MLSKISDLPDFISGKSLQKLLIMKKIILVLLLLTNLSDVYSQQNPVKYTNVEWQAMMEDLEDKCESLHLSISKKRKKRKIKKDLKIVKALNEIVRKPYINHTKTLSILKKYKVKLHGPPRSMNDDVDYIWYRLIGGYIGCELYLVIKDDGSAYRINIDIDDFDYFTCTEMGDAPILSFHYVYKYLRPNMNFKLGFDGYEGSFMAKILLDKSM